MKEVRIFKDYNHLSESCAEFIFNEIKEKMNRDSKVNVVLSGGKTPESCYRNLADLLRDKSDIIRHIHWFLGDERWVPSNDSESNFKSVREYLLSGINAPDEQVYSWHACEKDQFKCANDYNILMEKHFHSTGGADILLLGMGDDGHTASLFPGGKTLLPEGEFGQLSPDISQSAIAVYVNKMKAWRLTLTPRFINKSHFIIFLISGENKQESFNRIINGDTTLPASWISGENVLYFVTKELVHNPGKTGNASLVFRDM